MNIYQVEDIENKIEQIARDNDGEIPEELIKELVEAQMQSLQDIEKMCQYLNKADDFIEACKKEEDRIKSLRENVIATKERIKKYMTPFVKEKEKIEVGTFKLSTRKSTSVDISEWFYDDDDNVEYMVQKIPPPQPDKKAIKEALSNGKDVPGAKLVEKHNLQIK